VICRDYITNLTSIRENCQLNVFSINSSMKNAKYIHLFKYILGEMNGLPLGYYREKKFYVNPSINEKLLVKTKKTEIIENS
jgi:hypothetical protein